MQTASIIKHELVFSRHLYLYSINFTRNIGGRGLQSESGNQAGYYDVSVEMV